MSTRVLTTRYAARFSCIGAACEDACCSGWSIGIDDGHYKKVRRALGQTKADREVFASSVKRVRSGATKAKFALMVLQPKTGDCSFLGEDRLCSLHARFGEGLLPDVCATHPKRQSKVGDRIEVAAVMSCPEAALQALLPRDAMELVDAEGTDLRALWMQLVENASPDSYEGAVDVVRGAMLTILAGADSITAALGTLVALAHALGDSFARGAPVDPARLVATLDDFARPDRAKLVGEELAKIEIPLSIAMLPLLRVLSMRLAMPEGRFRGVVENAIRAYAIPDPAIAGDVARAYAARRDALAPLVDARLGEILTSYALNHVFAHWYTGAPDLGVWVRGLVLRIGLARFLAFAHPDIEVLANAATPGDATRTIERVAVEIVYRMSREIEHHKPFLELLDSGLPSAMPGLEHALCLLKL